MTILTFCFAIPSLFFTLFSQSSWPSSRFLFLRPIAGFFVSPSNTFGHSASQGRLFHGDFVNHCASVDCSWRAVGVVQLLEVADDSAELCHRVPPNSESEKPNADLIVFSSVRIKESAQFILYFYFLYTYYLALKSLGDMSEGDLYTRDTWAMVAITGRKDAEAKVMQWRRN